MIARGIAILTVTIYFWMNSIFKMKRLLITAGVLFAFAVLAESCGSSKYNSRPPVHPRPPRKWVMSPQQAPAPSSVHTIG